MLHSELFLIVADINGYIATIQFQEEDKVRRKKKKKRLNFLEIKDLSTTLEKYHFIFLRLATTRTYEQLGEVNLSLNIKNCASRTMCTTNKIIFSTFNFLGTQSKLLEFCY